MILLRPQPLCSRSLQPDWKSFPRMKGIKSLCTSHNQFPDDGKLMMLSGFWLSENINGTLQTFKYSFCHRFLSGEERSDLMANRFDIRVENPGARQDWAIKPSLNSDCKPIVLDSELLAHSENSSHQTNYSISSFIPRWNIKEIGFIVIEEQLNDNASILTIVLRDILWYEYLSINIEHGKAPLQQWPS